MCEKLTDEITLDKAKRFIADKTALTDVEAKQLMDLFARRIVDRLFSALQDRIMTLDMSSDEDLIAVLDLLKQYHAAIDRYAISPSLGNLNARLPVTSVGWFDPL